MTLLEFVCEKLLGPPDDSDGNGQSYWTCPFCGKGDRKFYTLPVKEGFKHRAKCWRCNFLGDELDLLKLKHRDYSDRLETLRKWEAEYTHLFSRGARSEAVNEALANLLSLGDDAVFMFVHSVDIADRRGVELGDLAVAAARHLIDKKAKKKRSSKKGKRARA